LRVEAVDDGEHGDDPGRILDDGSVACGEGRVRLLAVQPPGGKSMSFEAYRRGHELGAGMRMESL